MTGKPYTMQEMKTIVDYLVEHKSYGEIRAKKMWVDFAHTKLTSRTWQSLKETFLKRILPDLHNPYYNLTVKQINSFRSGFDVSDRDKNKLEIQTIVDSNDDSNSNGHNYIEQTNNGNSKEVETTAGENITCSKIPQRSRSSADTVILDNCYETAEDIQRDLESNGNNKTNENPVPKSKSLRDCITYSEPLTPMLQEVIDDFTSENEYSDREGQGNRVENVQENDNSEDINEIPEPINEVPTTKSIATDVAKNAKGLSTEVVEEVLAQELDGSNKVEKKSPKKITQNVRDEIEVIPVLNSDEEISSMQTENSTEKNDDVGTNNNITAKNSEKPVAMDSENTEVSVANVSNTETHVKSSQLNISNSTVDASLPNNPEALKNKHSKNNEDKTVKELGSAVKVSNKTDKTQSPSKSTRKRSFSEDTSESIENKKKKLEIKLKSGPNISKKSTSELHMSRKEITSEKVELKAIEEQPKADKVSKVIEKPQVEIKAEINKTSTTFENDVAEADVTNDTEVRSNENEIAEIKNPCLENVSLFDEQFNKTKYNMSESSDTEQNKKETNYKKQEGPVSQAANDVIILKSHTESDTEVLSPPKKKTRAGVLSAKSEREKAISNMFGFASGGVGSKRRRQLSRRRRTISHNNASQHTVALASNSSEWSSDTDSENFVSPPRSRRNRGTRKFLKPQSAKILSLEEDGGLFVMYGKKIYPVVKDGRIVKNYITYLPESDSEEGESYWKQKYVEEKKKADEFKKLLEHAKEPQSRDTNSPIPQAIPLVPIPRNSNSSHHPVSEASNDGKTICLPKPDERKEEPKVNTPEKIKIKFMKNNEEVHLEGHWPQIHPVLEQVVQIFHKEVEPTVSERKAGMKLEPPENSKELNSGSSTPIIITPVDPEVHEKVNKIENEIFMEIEERAREEENEPDGEETNVTKSRKAGAPRKSSSSSVSHSPEKQTTISDQTDSKQPVENKSASKPNVSENENKQEPPKRMTRTTRNVLNETVNNNASKTIVQTRRSKQKLDSSITNEDEEVKYMFPPKAGRPSLNSSANKKTNQKTQKRSVKTPKIFSSPDNFSLNSMDSTQGYQDSDISPPKTELRKKKKLDMSSFMIKTRNSLRRSTRRRSHPYIHCDAYDDSSNSAVEASVKIIGRENSSLNPEAYRSESYQLLMPQVKKTIRQLESISETSPIGNETYFVKHLDSMSENKVSVQINNHFSTNSVQITSDACSSSNVSLPMSPELSVVENMSVSKDMVSSIEDYPTLNEMQCNEIEEQTMCRKYMISDVDVSVPLMQQECELESCNAITMDMSTDPTGLVTESLLSKIGTFNINDQKTATDTLDKKLHDLLLESAKKMTRTDSKNKESMMDVDVSSVQASEVKKKVKAKKRCSTPRKRTASQKSKAPKIDPVIEEEHIESYSHSGRKSCPPQFQTLEVDDNVINEEINIANLTIANEKPKGRKKKDIIRVKIQRPKAKKAQEKLRAKSAQNASRISVFTDSGINDTESEVFRSIDDSVDLIHNHSETCLLANECVSDSVEFVENSKSVITLGDSMQSGDNAWNNRSECNNENSTSPDLFCNNAQDVSFYNKTNSENIESTSDTVYHSPLGTEVSHNSLITEDLSDDPPPVNPTKWYLLSEDETTNANIFGQPSTMLNTGSFSGSNLKQLFPIACAIPDLSTITEMSRENDDSRKPTLDLAGLTGDDFNSQSIFDSNF